MVIKLPRSRESTPVAVTPPSTTVPLLWTTVPVGKRDSHRNLHAPRVLLGILLLASLHRRHGADGSACLRGLQFTPRHQLCSLQLFTHQCNPPLPFERDTTWGANRPRSAKSAPWQSGHSRQRSLAMVSSNCATTISRRTGSACQATPAFPRRAHSLVALLQVRWAAATFDQHSVSQEDARP